MRKLSIILLSLFMVTSCVFKKKDKTDPSVSIKSPEGMSPISAEKEIRPEDKPKQPEPLVPKDKDPQIRTDKNNLVKPPSLDTISAH